jgi:predicted lipoprotein with Yx(FWY)xxD motif
MSSSRLSPARRTFAVAVVATGALIFTAGCGNGGNSSAKTPPSRTATTAAKPAPAADVTAARKPTGKKVDLRRTGYGKILVDGRGRALYLFTREKAGGKPRCYGDCATAWPPFLSKHLPRAGSKIAQSKLGTVERSDGRRQATYDGHPLYYYVSDTAPGQVTCQAVREFGGYWYVVNRDGDAIR